MTAEEALAAMDKEPAVAMMSRGAANYVIDLLNTEVDSLREQLNEHGNSNPSGCTKACLECKHWHVALAQAEEAYDALRGDAVWQNTTEYTVGVAVRKPEGTVHQSTHTYSGEPLLVAIETDNRSWLPAAMRTAYDHFKGIFGGHEYNVIDTGDPIDVYPKV
jgi:hypothetical protein